MLRIRDIPSLDDVAAAFPHLEILGVLGSGGMGSVYKVRQPELDRLAALKILHPGLVHDPAFAERFAREARVLAKLSHPNIVTVYEHGEKGGYFYLLMEYVDGVNLRQAMRAGRFTPEQALAVVPGICDALQAAHSQGVWHRDIKPENILLDQRGAVKIVDFGIARIVGDHSRDLTLTLTGAALGSAAYMAPEQHERPHLVDHRADIYSLGVVIYELLTAELPLGRFPVPSERAAVNRRIDEIVLRTLAKERELRQQSADEVKIQMAREADRADRARTTGTVRPGLREGSLKREMLPALCWAAGLFGVALTIRLRVAGAESIWVRLAALGVLHGAILLSVAASLVCVYCLRPGRLVAAVGAAVLLLVLLMVAQGRGMSDFALSAAALNLFAAGGALAVWRLGKPWVRTQRQAAGVVFESRRGFSQASGWAAFGLLAAAAAGWSLRPIWLDTAQCALWFGLPVFGAFVLGIVGRRNPLGRFSMMVALAIGLTIAWKGIEYSIGPESERKLRRIQQTRTPEDSMRSLICAARVGDYGMCEDFLAPGLAKRLRGKDVALMDFLSGLSRFRVEGSAGGYGNDRHVRVGLSNDSDRKLEYRMSGVESGWRLESEVAVTDTFRDRQGGAGKPVIVAPAGEADSLTPPTESMTDLLVGKPQSYWSVTRPGPPGMPMDKIEFQGTMRCEAVFGKSHSALAAHVAGMPVLLVVGTGRFRSEIPPGGQDRSQGTFEWNGAPITYLIESGDLATVGEQTFDLAKGRVILIESGTGARQIARFPDSVPATADLDRLAAEIAHPPSPP